ncbi:hypothetical protein RDE2_46400 [Rhodococcus sp. RDE2]|nr:hypothetical protein RDE2_46400 [Rhodococcus sp. RDE2]
MGRQSQYTEEFRRDAIALYRAGGGTRTYAAVASDRGISGETLRTWVRKDNASDRGSAAASGGGSETAADELAPAGRERPAAQLGEGMAART